MSWQTVKHSTVHLFADDCIIMREIKDQKGVILVQEDVDSAGEWANDWLMAFHPASSNHVMHDYILQLYIL